MKRIDLSQVEPIDQNDNKEEFRNPYEMLKEYEGKILAYRDICDIVGEEYNRGGRITNQINKWNKYGDIQPQSKGKYLIHKIYTDEEELGILKSYGKYTRYIEQFLLDKFYQIRKEENPDHIVLTNREILQETSMVNSKYFKGKYDPNKYLDDINLSFRRADLEDDEFEMNYLKQQSNLFFSGSYRLLSRIIYNSLKILEKKSLIVVNKTFRLYRMCEIKNPLDETKNKVIYQQKDCTDDEVSRILQIQYDSMEEANMEIDNSRYKRFRAIREIKDVHYLYKRDKEIYSNICKRNFQNEFNGEWDNYGIAWSINLAKKESIEYEIKKRQSYKQLNRQVQNKLLTSKELGIISEVLREQFIRLFIEKYGNSKSVLNDTHTNNALNI